MNDLEYIKQAEEAIKEAIDITRSTDGWNVEKEDRINNLIVEMKKNAQGRNIYRCKVCSSESFLVKGASLAWDHGSLLMLRFITSTYFAY